MFRVTPQGRVRFKVCGLTDPRQIEAAAEAGAGYVGLVFFPRSLRAVTAEKARETALAAPVGVAKVGLFVDASQSSPPSSPAPQRSIGATSSR